MSTVEPDIHIIPEPPHQEGDVEPVRTINLEDLKAETQPILTPEKAEKVEILIYDPNTEGIGELVQLTAKHVGRPNCLIVKSRGELVRFLQTPHHGKSRLDLIVINSTCAARGKEATEMDTVELFSETLTLANEILSSGQVKDKEGNIGDVPRGIEMIFLAPRDQDRLEGAIKRATKIEASDVVNRLTGIGLPPKQNALAELLARTIQYTLPISNEGDTI